MPPIVLTVIGFIQLAIKAAPAAKELYAEAHSLIDAMFKNGLINAAQQAQLKGWCDAHMEATLAGTVPPELTVE